MKIKEIYLIGVHRYAFRSGEKALVTGVKIIQPSEDKPPRPCFELLYDDGVIDYVPLAGIEEEHWLFTTKEET